MQLLGRRAELETLEQLMAGARAGRSGVLVVRGEAGIGKTALLEHGRATADLSGFRVESSVGVESETGFAFAGLHQLCAPLLDDVGALAEPQQEAIGVAFGLLDGAAPDRFLVGLAVLNLLAEAAEEAPLLCLVDDAQWLDQASAEIMAFVARRVEAERVALLFAVRDPSHGHTPALAGLPELRLERLAQADARTLLASAVRTPLDDRVRERIVDEAGGNPLALLELPRSSPPAQLAGGFDLPGVLDVPIRVEDSFRGRSGSLPAETQLLLLVAAAEPTGEVALLWQAAEKLGIDREAATAAEAAGLLEIGTLVRFRHPLVRSAVYKAATPADQRRSHAALAAITDPQVDPDRRAWHRAQSVLGTDEDAAAELERSADRARARGGLAASAAFLQRAVELTPEPARRSRRALAAAQDKYEAGAPDPALELLAVAEVGPLDPLPRARLELLRARIAFHQTRGTEGPRALLDAAETISRLDPSLARETYLHALEAATIIGGLGDRHAVQVVAEAASEAPPPSGPPGPVDLLLDGLVTAQTRGYEAGVPGLRRAMEAFGAQEPHPDAVLGSDGRRWSRIAMALWDDEALCVLTSRSCQLARKAGALARLPLALLMESAALVLTGDLARAAELAAEGVAISRSIGAAPLRHAQLMSAAWRGRQDDVSELYAAILEQAAGRTGGTEVVLAEYTQAVLHNGLGNYADALSSAARACGADQLAHNNLALPELVEAAIRAGERERADDALDSLTSRARASGTQWALGLAARSQALTSTGPTAEEHYQEALDRLRDCRMTVYVARTHLVYGEWLRREGRRRDAREQLRTAYQLLSDMGVEAFAERAARELRATGEHPRKRTAQPTDELTAHELHIARLVATGATSREVAAQLFLSPRTIEAHLRSIFRKLGITSRRQLRDFQLP